MFEKDEDAALRVTLAENLQKQVSLLMIFFREEISIFHYTHTKKKKNIWNVHMNKTFLRSRSFEFQEMLELFPKEVNLESKTIIIYLVSFTMLRFLTRS